MVLKSYLYRELILTVVCRPSKHAFAEVFIDYVSISLLSLTIQAQTFVNTDTPNEKSLRELYYSV